LQLAFDPNQERQFHFPIFLSLFLDNGVLHMTTALILVGSRTFVLSEEISRHIFARCEGPLRKGSICREETMHPSIKFLLVVRGVVIIPFCVQWAFSPAPLGYCIDFASVPAIYLPTIGILFALAFGGFSLQCPT
jgi:hypothetical protein